MIDKFQQRFIDEAKEHFENIELSLINLEEDFSNEELIGEIFRSLHSLKGSGAMFGFTLLSDATHDLESLYDLIRSGEHQLDSSIVSFTLKSLDLLKQLLVIEATDALKQEVALLNAEIAQILADESIDSPQERVRGTLKNNIKKKAAQLSIFFVYFKPNPDLFSNGTNPLYLIDELHSFGKCTAKADFSEVPELAELDPEKCYVSWRVLLETSREFSDIEDVFLFVKEDGRLDIIPVKNDGVNYSEKFQNSLFELEIDEAIKLAEEIDEVDFDEDEDKITHLEPANVMSFSSIRVDAQKIDGYMNLVSEMITAQSRLALLSEACKDQALEAISETFDKLIRQLRDNAFDMSLVPMYNMVARFKRLVRDLSAEMNKEIEIVTEGLETEVDKNVIEKLADPLLHIIRNCIDHGIETTDERLNKGKDAKGTIHVKASYVGTFVQIEISDDGSGLDFAKIRQKGMERGMLEVDSEPSQSELTRLILAPGFSTANSVSGLSGRGVGMDVVQRTIKNLRGELEIDSTPGKGTRFTLRLPLTLSIIDGLLTKVNEEFFVIPTANIDTIYALKPEKQEKGIRQVVAFDGREIPYLNLREEFNSDASFLQQQYLIAVEVGNNQLFGVVVDDVLREYQAVVKPLGKMLKKYDIFFGASILGDGKIALVLDLNKVVQKFSA